MQNEFENQSIYLFHYFWCSVFSVQLFNVRKFMRTTKQFFIFIQFLLTIYLVHCQNVRSVMSDAHSFFCYFSSFVLFGIWYLLLVFSMDTVISLIFLFFFLYIFAMNDMSLGTLMAIDLSFKSQRIWNRKKQSMGDEYFDGCKKNTFFILNHCDFMHPQELHLPVKRDTFHPSKKFSNLTCAGEAVRFTHSMLAG